MTPHLTKLFRQATKGPIVMRKNKDRSFYTHDKRLVLMDPRQFFFAEINADADEHEDVDDREQLANARLLALLATHGEALVRMLDELQAEPTEGRQANARTLLATLEREAGGTP